jgi:hypothetical protein
VLQAAGRVIRSDQDRGALLLVDQRFGRADYHHLLPSHWSGLAVHSAQQLERQLENFWSRQIQTTSGKGGRLTISTAGPPIHQAGG